MSEPEFFEVLDELIAELVNATTEFVYCRQTGVGVFSAERRPDRAKAELIAAVKEYTEALRDD